MNELRAAPRVGIHIDMELTTPTGRKLRARSENLSIGGAMLTLSASFELEAGDEVELAFSLPQPQAAARSINRKATVRWTSELLPELLGVAFDRPLADDEAALVEGLVP